MHRLRKGKKGGKEEEDGVPPVPPAATSHNLFKWGRTPEPPPKPELDIEHALPPSDDFRTSLLMPNLAQRFSILQMEAAAAAAAAASGKMNGENFSAAPDGFVFPNPQFTPLREITETSSLAESGTVEQNRLTMKSQESIASDESAGIMNRSRGGEGNVLFGGRQKVYRVPNAYTSSRDPADDSNPGSPMGGRVVYDYDLSETAFVAPGRRKEQDLEDINSPASDSNEDNRNRYTSSSTGSTPTTITRSSTAATSVTSNRAVSGSIPASASTSSLATASGSMMANKPRRALYEQALDQQLQDQQSTATGRLEKLASLRKASTSPPPTNNYPSVGNFSSSELGQHPSASSPSSPAALQPQWSVKVKKSLDLPMSAPSGNEEGIDGGGEPGSGGLSPHMAQFNFGLEPRSQSPISAPVSASAIQFPTQGPFSPGNLRGDQQQGIRSPDKINPLEQKRMPSPLSDLSGQYGQSAAGADTRKFLSARSSSDLSSYGDPEDSDNEGESKPVSRSYLDNVAPLHLRKSGGSSMGSVSEPPEPVSPVSPISPVFNERRLEPSVRGLQPLRNPAISPSSPQFSSGVQVPSDDDSPTLPAGPGLSMLIHQHLRTDSGHSSVYAGSTYTRMSRNSPYGTGPSKNSSVYGVPKAPETAHPSASGASGSSGGNMWEFDDWDAGYYVERDDNGVPSPLVVDTPPPPPSVPLRATARVRSEDNEELAREKERGRTESRFGERDRAMSRASERERSIPAAAEDEHDKDWEQQLAFRRQIIQQNLRNHEKVNSQHEMNFPSENFRDSQSKSGGSPTGFGGLRSKGSNGILSKNDPSSKPPKQSGRDSPGPVLRKEGRSRMSSDADKRTEEERMLRETVRGPKNIPSVNYPMQQHQNPHHHLPPQRSGHLNTNQSPELRTQRGSPIGLPHPLHSPMHTPRLKQKPSREQVNGGPRGQPMGWNDERDHQFSAPRSAPSTQPTTPTTPNDRHMPRKQPSMPRMNGPEMYRPNQGQSRDQDPRQGRGNPERGRVRENGPPNGAHMNHGPINPGSVNGGHGLMKKQSFDRGDASPDSRRPRGNSNTAPGPTMRQRRGTFDGTPLPPLNTTALTPAPSPQLQSSVSPVPPKSAASADKSPAYPQMHGTPTNTSSTTPSPAAPPTKGPTQLAQTMTSANSLYTPAKKRVIDKSKIGEPKLLSSTSNITTVDLPVQAPTVNGKSSKRRMTETRSIFGGFGRNKSTEEVPSLPTGSPMIPHRRSEEDVERSSFTDDPPPKKKGQGKLRKSTSDGGALGSRARKQEAMTRSPTMPKISKTMGGGPPAGMI